MGIAKISTENLANRKNSKRNHSNSNNFIEKLRLSNISTENLVNSKNLYRKNCE